MKSKIKCPTCKSEKYTRVSQKEIKAHMQSGTQFKDRLDYNECQNCGVKYRINVNKKELTKLYKGAYKKKYSLKKKILLRVPYSTHYNHKVKFVKYLKPKTMLDVGSSEGKFMWLMKLKGWKVKGVEPSKCAEFAKKFYKHKIHRCILHELDKKKKYDLVTSLATVEHVFDPKKFVSEMKDLVNEGGRLFISVPTRSYCAEHLTMFTPKSMKILLENLGLEVERMEEVTRSKEQKKIGGSTILVTAVKK